MFTLSEVLTQVSRDLTPNNNCVLLPVTVLQYISSINYKRKLHTVLHAQHRASSTYICMQVQYFTVHNTNNLISIDSFVTK